jgi:hypothetical protein
MPLKYRVRLGALAVAGAFLAAAAHADTISGPSLSSVSSGYAYEGIAFTAQANTALTSFTWNSNPGGAYTIGLYSSTGTLLDSVSMSAQDSTAFNATVDWTLSQGDQYYLIAGNTGDAFANGGLFSSYGTSLPSDDQITITNSGIFTSSLSSATSSPSGNTYWFGFTDITTGAPSIGATPEPSSLLLLGSGIPLAWGAIRQRRRPIRS